MRLIDADIMAEDESEAYLKAQTSDKISPITQGINSVVHRKIQQLIADTPTIDPEALPVVRELRRSNEMLKSVVKTLIERSRAKTSEIDELCEKVPVLDEKLHRVTAQRDAAMRGELVESIKLCLEKSPDKNTVYIPRMLIEKLAFVIQEEDENNG